MSSNVYVPFSIELPSNHVFHGHAVQSGALVQQAPAFV